MDSIELAKLALGMLDAQATPVPSPVAAPAVVGATAAVVPVVEEATAFPEIQGVIDGFLARYDGSTGINVGGDLAEADLETFQDILTIGATAASIELLYNKELAKCVGEPAHAAACAAFAQQHRIERRAALRGGGSATQRPVVL